MKKLIFAMVFLMAGMAAFGQTKGVQFEEKSMSELLQMAKEQNKPVFIDIYTTWCGPCKYMSNNVFTQQRAGDYFNENFINAKFDAEKGEGIQVAKEYGVRAYPTFIIIDPDGKEIGKVIGGDEVDAFIQKVKSVVK